MANRIRWTKFQVEDDEQEDLEEDYPEENPNLVTVPVFDIRANIKHTIIGPIDISSNQNILNHFNIWIMDTSFKQKMSMLKKINDTHGVELLYPISQYKCVVGFGNLFSPRNVMIDIEAALIGKHKDYITLRKIKDKETRKEALNIFSRISKFPFWLIYIFPNGKIINYSTSDEEDYKLKYIEYKELKKLSQGILVGNNRRSSKDRK